MELNRKVFFGVSIIFCCLSIIFCQDPMLNDFFMKASKNIPRIGRSGNNKGNNDDFENFFLKASKSVPRIGRRDPVQYARSLEDLPNSFIYSDKSEMGPNMRKHPNWSEIAKLLNYNGEIANSRLRDNENYGGSIIEKEFNRMKRTSE